MKHLHRYLQPTLVLALLTLYACSDAEEPVPSEPATVSDVAWVIQAADDATGDPGAGDTADAETRDLGDLAEVSDAADVETEEIVEVEIAFTITASSHVIVREPDASPSEVFAAEELQTHLQDVLSTEIEIVTEIPAGEGSLIVLGMGPVAAGLGVEPDLNDLGEQGFVTRTIDQNLVIAGTPEAGTLYGAHRFLEDVVGVRWWAPGATHIPELSEIPVPVTDALTTPAFLWRNTSYNWPGKDDTFYARMGGNSGSGGADHPYGVQHSHDGRAHSYFWYVSPSEFFDEHPEYFSEIGGVRIRDETQLCLTNPDLLDIVTERMLQRMADRPGDRQHNFSQKDYYNYCQCDACSAINEQYGTAGGTQFWFVNKLAQRTSLVYPDKLIGTLAYMYTEEPPINMEMHPNVAVWLCHMFPSCDSHPIDTCVNDADYHRRAVAWSEITDHLYIWHYIVDFMHYYNPFPNFRAMSADMRFYRDIGVEGIYLQAMGHGGGGGEFSLLRPYYGMHLLWDPDRNPFRLRRDWLQGYYGAAWQPIERYIEMLHDKVTDDDIHMHLYTNPAQGYLTDAIMEQAEAYFDEAEDAVSDDEDLLERVRVARMPLTYANIFPRNGYTIEGGQIVWESEIASMAQLNEFITRMQRHGFTTVREVAGDIDTLRLLYLLINGGSRVYELNNGAVSLEITPGLGGRLLRITELTSGEVVTAYNVKESLYFPFAGGLEDRVGEGFRFYGWVEPSTLTSSTDLSITLNKDTLNGYDLTKTYRLHESEPIIYVESVLTNPSDSAVDARLRSHLELDLGDVVNTRVQFTTRGGDDIDHDMTNVVANLREGEHFYDQDVPDGAWTFSGSKGLTVTQRFDHEQIDYAWIYAYPETLGEVELELWVNRTRLEAGESVTLTQEIEVRPVD